MRIITLFLAGIIASCSVQTGPFSRLKPDNNRNYSRASFLPENNYANTKHYYSAGEVTEQDFQDVLDAITEIYTPIFSGFGANLNVYGDWNDETINAYADQAGNAWNVSFFGGLAKHPYMTREGFAMVACHEIGHHVAGLPLYANNDWAAVEGQSDYYATASCAKMMFDPNSPLAYRWSFMKKRPKPSPEQNCNSTVCKLSMDAGLSLGKVLAELNNETMPSYETPSKVVVKKTMESHPPAQCRVDSYKAGALCNKQWNNSIIPTTKAQENAVNCDRPKCWYKA